MTLEQWLSDVYYDEWGTHIWNKVDKDGGSQLVADVRGWGAIQQIFKTHKECVAFQDEVGKFIVEAIREKIERLPQKEISDEEIAIEFAEWIRIKDFQTTAKDNWIGLDMQYYTTKELYAKWYREQLKSKGNGEN